MKNDFKNFYRLFLEDQEELGVKLNKDKKDQIQFKMPIRTFGKTMGYNYVGIEKMDFDYYNSIMNELFKSQMMNPEYLKMSVGR